MKFIVHHLIKNNIPAESIAAVEGQLNWSDRELQLESFRNGDRLILIATDLASRGLDFPHLRQVINFDFPKSMSDYIHRCGRLARVNSIWQGAQVTNYVTYQSDVEMVWQLEAAARRMIAEGDQEPLPDVDANIKRKLRENWLEKNNLQQSQMQEQEEHLPFPRKFLGLDE